MNVLIAHPSTTIGRGWLMAAALVLAIAAAFGQALAAPGRALACSCVQPLPTIAEVASGPGVAVIAGTIGPQTPERTPVQVDTWFHGDAPTDVVWLSFGSQMLSSCDPFVTQGERRLLVIHRQDPNLYSVNPCVASGVIGTESGDAALAAAFQLFGEGVPSPVIEPTDPPPVVRPEPAGTDAAPWFIIVVIGAAVMLFAVVGFVALRRRPSA